MKIFASIILTIGKQMYAPFFPFGDRKREKKIQFPRELGA